MNERRKAGTHTIKCEETGPKEATECEEEKEQRGQRERFAPVNVTVNIGFNQVNSSRLFEFLLFSSLVNETKEQGRKGRGCRGSIGH